MDAITDFYPSRDSAVASIVPRTDPVVYGGAMPAEGLLPETLDKYRDDGFLVFDNFLDARSVAALTREMTRRRAEAAAGDPVVVREPSCDSVRSIFDMHKRSPMIGELVRDPAILGPVHQILGGPVYVHQTRVNFASGASPAPFYWHSDFETWHVKDGMPRMRAVTVQISLTDSTPESGPLMLIPGSHMHYVPWQGNSPETAGLTGLIERNGIRTVTAPAGSMVMFDCNTLHGSNGNITPAPRITLCIVYNSVDNRPAMPFDGSRPRPSFLASREESEEL